MDIKATVARHKPELCLHCGSPCMDKSEVKKYPSGAVSIVYRCRTCLKKISIKLYDIPPAEQEHKVGGVLKILSPKKIDRLIRSVAGNHLDQVQETWLEVLRSSAQSEEDVLAIARSVSSKGRGKYITEEHILRSLNAPLGAGENGNFTLESVLAAPEEDLDKELDARYPIKPSLKVRIASMSIGEELDLSTISRVEVANAVHCVPEHISAVFLGKSMLSLPLAYDIAKFLRTTIDHLYRAICGANGKNPSRTIRCTWKDSNILPPKYTVHGKGYPNLKESLQAIGVTMRNPTHYNQLPDDQKALITRNRPTRGR